MQLFNLKDVLKLNDTIIIQGEKFVYTKDEFIEGEVGICKILVGSTGKYHASSRSGERKMKEVGENIWELLE